MKRIRILLAITTVMFLGLVLFLLPVATPISAAPASIPWVKYTVNPVLEEGVDWDYGGVGAACVIWDAGDSLYKMWYSGVGTGPVLAIGYITSANGREWMNASNPVLEKSVSGFDEDGVGSCSVIKESDTSYKMWYTGYKDETPAIGYATSDDGIDWYKHAGNPVLERDSGEWDADGVLSPCVIWDADESLYKMWYTGRTEGGGDAVGGLQIGYAESTDGGITWGSRQKVTWDAPPAAWEARGVGVGSVIDRGGTYHMWYTGYEGSGKATIEVAIGHASSSDGVIWEKGTQEEVTKGTGWEANGVGAPWVIYDDVKRTYRMWYSGLDSISFDPTLGYASYKRPTGGGGGAGGAGDSTPPRLANISISNIAKTTADIYWTTNEYSTSQVEYWASPHMSELDEEMVINHHVRLEGLTPASTYYYKTMSQDKSGNLAVSDEYTFTTLGTPAAFSVSALDITPTEVEIGEEVTFSVRVDNTGDAPGSYEVTLKINGAAVATKEATVAGGFTQTITFTVAGDAPGTYTASIDGLTGTFVVKAAAPPKPPPPPTPTPPTPPVPPAPINWWLIGGIIAAVIAAAVVVWLTVIRRRAVT